MDNQNLEDLLHQGEERSKEANRQRAREYYANMTAEQKTERNHKQRVNMTEKQKEARRQRERERRANMTEEQKRAYKQHMCEYRANMSEKQKEANRQYQREWYANMTNEQRIERKRKQHESRVNMSEKQKEANRQYQRKFYTNMTKEQKETKNQRGLEYKNKKALKLGFDSYTQQRRYNRWRKKNNASVSVKDLDYLIDIQYWKENIDGK